MNLALSDEQVFLREAARGALSRFKTLEAAREALDGDADALPDLWPTACEAGWPGLLIDEDARRRRPRRLRRDARARRVRPRARRRRAARPPARHGDPRRRARRGRVPGGPGQRRAARRLSARAARPTTSTSAGAPTRPHGLARAAAAERRSHDGGRPRARQRQLRVRARCPRRRRAGRRGAAATASPIGVAIARRCAGRQGRAGARATTPPARSGTSRSSDAPAVVLDAPAGVARRRLAPRPGADRGRVARQRRDGAGRVRRLRQGALHVRPCDRLLPGGQALAHRGAAPARERPLAALLRGLGAPRRARRSSRSPPTPRARSPAGRSTRPRAR